jgi:hypothetical protein
MISAPYTSLPCQRFRASSLVESLLGIAVLAVRWLLGSPKAKTVKRWPKKDRRKRQSQPMAYRSYGAWLDAYHRIREAVDAQASADHPDDSASRMAQIKAAMRAWTQANGGSDTSGWSEQERAVHEVSSNPSTWDQ